MRQALLALLVSTVALTVLAADQSGHPLITPYKGSTLSSQEGAAFDEVPFLVGKQKNGSPVVQKVEGKSTYLQYDPPAGRTELEILKNYEQALRSAGFTTVFSCAAGDCPEVCEIQGIGCSHEGGTRYLSSKLVRPNEGNVWVQVKTSPYVTKIAIVEEKPMETGMVSVDAAALKKGIESDGHIAVYGIVFDTNKAELKPQADPILEQIAKLLKASPQLKLHVVGHTDNAGDLASNIDLSKRRAAAVVQALVARHGVDAKRLRADGVGPLASIASNRNETGRAKNRRVDLVEQ